MWMAEQALKQDRFGEIAVSMNMVPQEKLDRALVIQKMIFSRTKVHMSIGKVLKEMGIMTQAQVDSVLETQRYISVDQPEEREGRLAETQSSDATQSLTGLKLIISEDKLGAFLCPSDAQPKGLSLEAVKDFIAGQGVDYGLVEDEVLVAYISQTPLPGEPFQIAAGTPPTAGREPQVIYHFDTDPLRIGTLKSDGTMDWKNRGEIPQVNVGDLLVEKKPGEPGLPGTSVYGQVLQPPRVREPRLKSGKGAQRSDDGNQILAKVDGMPKLSADGKVFVFDMLNIEGDIGIETGNVEFEGYIEAKGLVTAGYSVKAKGLRTAGIQDAVIEVTEDLVCDGGMYGSTIKVGGNLKASHIHNCKIEILGDLVVQKEIFDSTIEVGGRCMIAGGKTITSQIDAKKGIEAMEIGSAGSSPCRLTVGFDRKLERDLAECQSEMEELNTQKTQIEDSLPALQARLKDAQNRLTQKSKERQSYLDQKQQFEEQLRGEGPNPVEGEEEKLMLEEMIAELDEKDKVMNVQILDLSKVPNQIQTQIVTLENSLKSLEQLISEGQEKTALLEETAKVDPGVPVIRVEGTIYSKTQIVTPHREMVLEEEMQRVRIAEAKEDPNSSKYQIKISNLR
jgi:uncharacterized protein (DUF342 family)